MTLPLTITFIIIGTLLLWFVIGSKGKWYLKFGAILTTLIFGYLSYSALGSFSGWPAAINVPKRSLFVSGEVIEPNKSTGEKGRIYIWLIPPRAHVGVFGYNPKGSEPRAFSLPYSRNLHQAVSQALAAQKKGHMTELRNNQQSNRDDKGSVVAPGKYKAYILPPTQLPPKPSQ